MSLKKFFKSNAESAPSKAPKQQFNVSSSIIVESLDAAKQKANFDRKIFAYVDISASLANYVRFGSAEYHYSTGIERIYSDYPYDGTQAEKYKFLNDSNTFDFYIWKQLYPKTTGYISLNEEPLATQRIEFKGGPNVDNVYDSGTLQINNLKFDSEKGVTVEFWAKPTPTDGPSGFFELNDSALGHVAIYPQYSTNDIVWVVESQQGLALEASISFTSLASAAADWHHYAFVFSSFGAGSGLTASLYVDGVFTEQKIDTSNVLTSPINAVSGNLGQYMDPASSNHFWYTGSIDEFRYWKSARTAREIGLNWNTHVDGGSNSVGTTERPLSTYFKFNEGVTGNPTTDAIILDYSGRVASASFINYEDGVRSTDSAIAAAGYYEVPDPIVYSIHPDVAQLETSASQAGRMYDRAYRHSIYDMMPEWVVDEDTSELKYLSHIIGAYFDELYAQIATLDSVKDKTYQDQKLKIFPFYETMLTSHGFDTQNFLVGSNLLAEINDKTTVGNLSTGSISDLKNTIYRNIYNNLLYIYKTKGTQKSIRNLLHCYGVDQNLVRLRTYSNNTTTTIENRDEVEQYKDKTIDFFGLKNFVSGTSLPNESSVFNFTASSEHQNQSYISPFGNAFTIESNLYFSRQEESSGDFWFGYDTTGSLFGIHAASDSSPESTTFAGSDVCGMAAYAAHTGRTAREARFVLSSSNGNFTAVQSDAYDLYDSTNWNLALIFEAKNDQRNLPSGTISEYWARLIGYQVEAGQTINSFNISSSIGTGSALSILSEPKRVFVGAERDNFTGSILYRSQARVGNCKFYADSLEEEEVRLHATYKNSEGRLRPFENMNRKNDNDTLFVPYYLSTVFHWDFEQVTSPDAHGQFLAKDITSASLNFANDFGDYGEASAKVYSGFGYNFPIGIKAYENEFISKLRSGVPDESTAANIVNAQGESTIVFKPNEAPARDAAALAKSMYGVISQDILSAFAGVGDFNYLIGKPVNKYRQTYKDMEGLRRLYFERVENTPQLEKFTNYFKWLDGIIDSIVDNIFPATTNLASDSPNMVESHILERSKYPLKYPTLEYKPNRPSASINNIVSLKNIQLTTATKDDSRRIGSVAPFNYKSASLSVPNYVNVVEIGATIIPSGNIDPVVIKNTAYKTSSSDDRTDAVTPRNLASSTIGNYRHPYDVVQSVGQHGAINGLYLANESLVPADNPSPYVSGTLPYAMPNRNKYQTIIRSIFNAPGSPETYGEGLDTAVRELSVYNNLNYRNRGVRDALDTLYSRPSAFGGYQSGSTTIASYHGTQRNGYTRPIQEGTGSYSSLSVHFNASSSPENYIEIGNGNNIVSRKEFTISLWFNMTSEPGTYHTMVYAGQNDAYEGWSLGQFAGMGGIWFQHAFTGVVSLWYADDAIEFDQWYHLALTYTAENTNSVPTLYLNGVSQSFSRSGTPTGTPVICNSTGSIRVGNDPSAAGRLFPGYMDELSVWSKELSLAEVRELYYPTNAILGPANLKGHSAAKANSISPNGWLAGWWRMGEGSQGTGPNHTLTNQISRYTHATMHNFTVLGGYGTASAPPSNSAGTLNTLPTYGTKKIWDNAFVQTEIPATDLQYAWITASYQSADLYRYQNTTNPDASKEQITFVSSSDMVSFSWSDGYRYFGTTRANFAAQANATNAIPTDFVRLNTNIYEPITSSQNLLGYPDFTLTLATSPANYFEEPGTYFNLETPPATWTSTGRKVQIDYVEKYANADLYPGPQAMLNSLLLHRNGPYGFPSWKALRKHDNPIVKSHRETNTISYITSSKLNTRFGELIISGINNVTQSAVSTTEPLFIQLSGTSFDFKTSYENKKLGFTNEDLQTQQTRFENATNAVPTFLDKVLKEKVFLKEKELVISKLTLRSNVYPRTEFQFLNATRNRDTFDNTWWRTQRGDRNLLNQNNSMGMQILGTSSRWSMDNRVDSSIIPPVSASTYGSGSGELLNPYTTYHYSYPPPIGGTSSYAPIYARRVNEIIFSNDLVSNAAGMKILNKYNAVYSGSYVNVGTTPWEVASQSGKEPFYNSYADYAEELRLQGKNYSIVPEFRMDNYIETYLSNGFDFKAQQQSFLSISGTSNTNIAKRYSAAELSDVLGTIQTDTKLGVTKFGLKAKAYLKLLPYEGFYPQQRTLQLAAELSRSLAPAVQIRGMNGTFKTAMQPFTGPGILFNTIKSGIAVSKILRETTPDVSLNLAAETITTGAYAGAAGSGFTANDLVNRVCLPTSSQLWLDPAGIGTNAYDTLVDAGGMDPGGYGEALSNTGSVSWLSLIGHYASGVGDATVRELPFEAILNPGPYLTEWWDDELAPGLLYSAVVPTGTPKINYTLMSNNFFAETTNFFLSRGLTAFESKAKDVFTFEEGKEYAMDVVLKSSDVNSVSNYKRRILQQAGLIDAQGAVDPAKLTLSGSFTGSGGLFTASFTCLMYDKPEAFGPPSIFEFTDENPAGSALHRVMYRSWSLHTPPYYNGLARSRIRFTPSAGVTSYTMAEIINQATIDHFRAIEAPQTVLIEDNDYYNSSYSITSSYDTYSMKLSASVILDAVVEEKKTVYSDAGDIQSIESYSDERSKLVIHTKYECPVLDFNNVQQTLPTYGSSSAPRGMWHQYGSIPNYSDTGIFLEVMDVPIPERNRIAATASLADIIGVQKDSKAIGRLATSRQIEEALVVLPYYVERTKRGPVTRFFEFNSTTVEKMLKKANRPSVLTDSDQIVRQIRLMKKYVFPPFMDFVTFPDEANVKSPLMYVFEFGRTLSQQDLADIWQGVLPDAGRTAVYREAIIDLDTSYEGIKGGQQQAAPTDVIATNIQTLLATRDIEILDSDTKLLNEINFNELDFYVFKVKKRAEYEYSKVTQNTTDDQYQFDFKATGFQSVQPFFKDFGVNRLAYSYNYPYDFFSLIELAKIDAQIEMEDTDE
jgi:hypothetical protein